MLYGMTLSMVYFIKPRRETPRFFPYRTGYGAFCGLAKGIPYDANMFKQAKMR